MNFTSVHIWRADGGFRVTLSDTRTAGPRATMVSPVENSVDEAWDWVLEQVAYGSASPGVPIHELDVSATEGQGIDLGTRWPVNLVIALSSARRA